jgi:hypothetical protein
MLILWVIRLEAVTLRSIIHIASFPLLCSAPTTVPYHYHSSLPKDLNLWYRFSVLGFQWKWRRLRGTETSSGNSRAGRVQEADQG